MDLRNIEDLKHWKDNPRAVKDEDIERLKNQLHELGVYKPLLIIPDGTVIGGNMRFRALREMGKTKVWVNEVKPKNQTELLEYAFSDNDNVGYYDDQVLAEMIAKYNLAAFQNYKVDLNPPARLETILESLKPQERGTDSGGQVDKYGDYLNSNVRSVVFYFFAKEYEEVMNKMLKLQTEMECENNREVILKLLDFYEQG